MVTAVDRPLEVGHELVLSALLVHLDVDDVDALAPSDRDVVQYVYDIVADLAERKAAFQWKAATLEQERNAERTEYAQTRADRDAAVEEVGHLRMERDAALEELGRFRAERDAAVATNEEPTAPREHGAIALEKSTTRSSVSKAVPLSGRHWRLPQWAESMRVTPIGASMLRITSRPLIRGAVTAKLGRRGYFRWTPAPARAGDTALMAVKECLKVQLEGERRVHILQRKFNQVCLWRASYNHGVVHVEVPHVTGTDMLTVVHDIEHIRNALSQVCDEVQEVRNNCIEAVRRVEGACDDKSWILARQEKLDAMLSGIEKWVDDIAVMLQKLSTPVFTQAQVKTAAPSIWKPVRINRQAIVCQPNVEMMRSKRVMPTPWKPLTPVFVEYAIVSFLMEAVEILVQDIMPGVDFDALTKIGQRARELQSLVNKFEDAKKAFGEHHQRIDAWQYILAARHKATLRAIHQRALACSETICGVTIRQGDSAPLPRTTWTNAAKFPADRYSEQYYDDVVIVIVSCHVSLTRLHEAEDDKYELQKTWIIDRLTQVANSLAPWADPRFSEETTAHKGDKNMFLKLMDWCDVLREIVAAHHK